MLTISSSKIISSIAFVVGIAVVPLHAADQHRLALVIGNGDYKAGALATTANDSALIARTLQNAGFEVTAARDLDGATLRRSLSDFTAKLGAAGPETVAFVYLGGYGLQLQGENYFTPVDATIVTDADIAAQSVKISDFLHSLTAQSVKSRFVVFDAARATPFAKDAQLSAGLAYIEPDVGSLVAFNAAPGFVAPEAAGANSVYAATLADFIAKGGLQPDDLFGQVRLKVTEITKSAEVPWHLAKLDGSFTFGEGVAAQVAPLEAAKPSVVATPAEAPKAVKAAKPVEAVKPVEAAKPVEAVEPVELAKPLQPEKPVKMAKPLPIPPKTLEAVRPPDEPTQPNADQTVAKNQLAQRKLAEQKNAQKAKLREEALAWQQADSIDSAAAYRTYLNRFPKGAHARQAQQALNEFTAEHNRSYVERGYDGQDAGPPAYRGPRAYYGPRYSQQLYDQYGEPLPIPPRGVYLRRRYVEQDDLDYNPPPRFGRFLFNMLP